MSTDLFQLSPEFCNLILQILIRDAPTNRVRGSGLGRVCRSGGDVTRLMMLGLLAGGANVSARAKVLPDLLGRDRSSPWGRASCLVLVLLLGV